MDFPFLCIYVKVLFVCWAALILALITSLLVMTWLEDYFRLKEVIRNAKRH